MSSRVKNCSICVHWQSYPLVERVGVCDNPDSAHYSRGVAATNEVCGSFVLNESVEKRCEECHRWHPLKTATYVGVCQDPASPRYKKAVLWDNVSGSCFHERSLELEKFAWCRGCRETIPASEFGRHRTHALYSGTSQLPLEAVVEATLASD